MSRILALAVAWTSGLALSAAPLPPAIEKFHKDGFGLSPEAPAVVHGNVGDKDTSAHLVRLLKGQTYQYDIAAPFGTRLKIEEAGALMHSTSAAKGTFAAPKDGLYRFTIESAGPASGKYVMTLVQNKTLVGFDPPGVRSVGPGGLSIADTIAAGAPLDRSRKLPCKEFRVRLDAGKRYLIDMKSGNFDTWLRVEDPAGRQLAEDDDSGGGLNSRILLTPGVNGIYTIICTSCAGGEGAFTLSVQEAR